MQVAEVVSRSDIRKGLVLRLLFNHHLVPQMCQRISTMVFDRLDSDTNATDHGQ